MPKRIQVLRAASEPGYQAEGLTVTLDSKGLAGRIAEAVAEHHRKAIRAGQKPSGGSQRALSSDERERASRGKRSRVRGMGSDGAFPASIEATRPRGGDVRAEASVAADAFFDEWQEAEDGRGVEYLEIEGDVDELVDRLLEDELKRQGFSD
jgi:hypothetical protein